MHNKEVRVDLKVSRKASGLLQEDLAHLLETTQPRISRLEQGKAVLSLEEVIKLTVIFGKSSIDLFRMVAVRAQQELAQRLASLPPSPEHTQNTEARQRTLSGLAGQLSVDNSNNHGNEN